MEGFSNKEVNYNFDSSMNNNDNPISSNEKINTINHRISKEEMETVDLDEFSGSIENDPYNVVDSGFSLDEVDLKSVNINDDEII